MELKQIYNISTLMLNYGEKKVTEGTVYFLKNFQSVAIFRPKMAENCHFCHFRSFFYINIATKQQILKKSKIPSVTFFAS